MNSKSILTIFTFLCFCTVVRSQDYVDWKRAERFSEDSLEQYVKGKRLYPEWIKGTHTLYYNVKGKDGVVHHYLVDAENGKRREMIKDNQKFAEQYLELTNDTLDANNLMLYGHRFKGKDLSRFYIKKRDKMLSYDLESGELTLATDYKEEKEAKPTDISNYNSKDSVLYVKKLSPLGWLN